MTKGFTLLAHTADVGIAASGSDLKEAFANAARGLFAVITNLSTVREVEERRVEVNAADLESLLVRWLDRLVYLFDVEHLLFRRFQVMVLTGTHLEARCYGERVVMGRHPLRTAVKAATYHRIRVEPGPPAKVRVYLDI